jgi:hypothetical protein
VNENCIFYLIGNQPFSVLATEERKLVISVVLYSLGLFLPSSQKFRGIDIIHAGGKRYDQQAAIN